MSSQYVLLKCLITLFHQNVLLNIPWPIIFIIHNPSSIIHNPSSIINHSSSIIHHQSIDRLPTPRARLDQSLIFNLKVWPHTSYIYHTSEGQALLYRPPFRGWPNNNLFNMSMLSISYYFYSNSYRYLHCCPCSPKHLRVCWSNLSVDRSRLCIHWSWLGPVCAAQPSLQLHVTRYWQEPSFERQRNPSNIFLLWQEHFRVGNFDWRSRTLHG